MTHETNRAPAAPEKRIPLVESDNLVTIRTRLRGAAEAGEAITLSGRTACALYVAMDTGKPMPADDPAEAAPVPASTLREPVMANGKPLSDYLESAAPETLEMDDWTRGYEECKRRLFGQVGEQLRALRVQHVDYARATQTGETCAPLVAEVSLLKKKLGLALKCDREKAERLQDMAAAPEQQDECDCCKDIRAAEAIYGDGPLDSISAPGSATAGADVPDDLRFLLEYIPHTAARREAIRKVEALVASRRAAEVSPPDGAMPGGWTAELTVLAEKMRASLGRLGGAQVARGDAILYRAGGEWVPARFVSTDLVGGEPIIQRENCMPEFATWADVSITPEVAAPERSDTPVDPIFSYRMKLSDGTFNNWQDCTPEHAAHVQHPAFANSFQVRALFATPTAASKALDAAPAGLEEVAEVVGWSRKGGGYDNDIRWTDSDQLPVGTKLYRIDGDKPGAQGENNA